MTDRHQDETPTSALTIYQQKRLAVTRYINRVFPQSSIRVDLDGKVLVVPTHGGGHHLSAERKPYECPLVALWAACNRYAEERAQEANDYPAEAADALRLLETNTVTLQGGS